MGKNSITIRNIASNKNRCLILASVMLASICGQSGSVMASATSSTTPVVEMMGVADGTSCAIVDGQVKCWGFGYEGINGPLAPAEIDFVSLGRAAQQIRTNEEQTIVLLDDGSVEAWNSTASGSTAIPSLVALEDVAVQVVAGADFACARLESGRVSCWGKNNTGQLGHGDTIDVTADDPVLVDLGEPAVDVAAGAEHACAVLESRSLRCWGLNASGQLGYGHTDSIGDDETVASTSAVSLDHPITKVVAGLEHTCALQDNGAIRCWGANTEGQLGYGLSIVVAMTRRPRTLGCRSRGRGGRPRGGGRAYVCVARGRESAVLGQQRCGPARLWKHRRHR